MATKSYKYVEMYHRKIGASPTSVSQAVQRAKETDAPENAVYEKLDRGNPTGQWIKTDEIRDPGVRKALGLTASKGEN